MPRPKRVLVIMNLACAGRSSMAAVLPVLAACGVQACPLPTALLSSHLGFGGVAMLPAGTFGEEALERLNKQSVEFDAIYTGYLLSEAEFALANHAMELYPGAYRLVDPALGDNGRLYSKTTPGMVEAMRQLAAKANCITPNLTESALLLGEDPAAEIDEPALQNRLAALAQNGRVAIVTSAPVNGGSGVAGQDETGAFTRQSHTVPGGYPGTGDLFTAALCGKLLTGSTLKAAATTAARFVESAIAATYAGGGTPKQGVWFEPHLPLLHEG